MLARTPLKDQMILWLENKDPQETYNWHRYNACACAQFAAAIGQYEAWSNRQPGDEWSQLDRIAWGSVGGNKTRTFGALKKRLLPPVTFRERLQRWKEALLAC